MTCIKSHLWAELLCVLWLRPVPFCGSIGFGELKVGRENISFEMFMQSIFVLAAQEFCDFLN